MKKTIYFLLGLFIFKGFSQNPLQNSPIYGGEQVIIEANNNIKGNDFIFDEWNKGILVLNDSIFSKHEYIRYDAYNDRVLVNYTNKVIEIDDNSLTSFSIFENKSNVKHDFVKLRRLNFKNEMPSGFYEVVFNVENTNYFIKKNIKFIYDPNRSKGSQTINNYPLEYKDKKVYYIKNNEGLYVKVRLKKNDIMGILTKNESLLNNYIKLKKVKRKEFRSLKE